MAYEAMTSLFTRAYKQERGYLFEHETYDLLRHNDVLAPPQTHLLLKGMPPSDDVLRALPGDKVVLKIVAPTILHKTETGGVRIVDNHPDKIRSAYQQMMQEVPETYSAMLERNPAHRADNYQYLEGKALKQAVFDDIQGVLMAQFMPSDSHAFGMEMIVGIRNTREFGMVISAGLGGTDTELYAEQFRKGRAIVAASTAMTDGERFLNLFRQTISYQKLAGLTRGQGRVVTDEQLAACFAAFISMANYYSPVNPEAPFVIQELEINPFAFSDGSMVPLDGMCRFSTPSALPAARPYQKIDHLLHPETIGIVGVSTSRVNFGRIILNNILAGGFDAKNIRIIRPGMDRFEGIACVDDLSTLDLKLDLLVVAVSSDNVPQIVDQVIKHDAAQTVMLIPGGMGETAGSRERAAQVMKKIADSHTTDDGGPVFLGANCLGVISHPGRYDTLFIPDEKLPKQRGIHRRNLAFVSQSGAFMITRLSKQPELGLAYMISVGNQNDLTLGDMVNYLKDAAEIDLIAVYAEGFKDLDGLAFCRAVRDAVIAGKDVIFYKAGRTAEGKTATSGHTASVAGDYMVCESCVRQAGGIVARSFSQFEDLLMLSQRLFDKSINGNRLAAISGAGFEAVGMADNIRSDDFNLTMAQMSPSTAKRMKSLIETKGLEGLVAVNNPLDINPGADDDAHVLAVKYLAEDPGVDAVVVGLDPLSPAMRTLAVGGSQPYSYMVPESIAHALPLLTAELDKPVVGVVDGGRLYNPLVDELMQNGMAIFRSSDQAVDTLALYIAGRLSAAELRLKGQRRQ